MSSGCIPAYIASHRIASHRIASHRIASHRIASHRIASHRIASLRIASHRIASHKGRFRLLQVNSSAAAGNGPPGVLYFDTFAYIPSWCAPDGTAHSTAHSL
jgi:hypothetical protein